LLDPSVIRLLSALLAIGGVITSLLFFGVFTRKREELGSVKASRPTGFVLRRVWLLLGLLNLIFYFLGAIVPEWVYGTPFNLSFGGAEYLQVASIFVTVSGALLFLSSGRVLGQYMRVEIVVSEKHELVTGGPYSRIRHPTYTGGLMIDLGTALLFLNIILVVSFVARVAMAYKRAVLEEALLSSDEGFGTRYQEYMGRTGRFLPKIGFSQRFQRSS
jgi:protein-S-isoprenylcysteine O-methyltransferase Ste14